MASQPHALLTAISGGGTLGRIGEGFRELVAAWFPAADAAAEADAAEAPSRGADALGDDELVDALRAIARLERSIEALKLQCSSAIARRSAGDSRHDGLAGRHGFATPERLIAATTGASTSETAKLITVAAATSTRESIGAATGRGPRYRHIAAAISAGTISVDIAHRITTFLDSLRLTVDADLEPTELKLLERAGAVGVDGLARYFKLIRAQLDKPGVAAREEELHARRSLRIWEDQHGLIHLRGCFDPATAAPIKLAVETLVSADLHAARDAKSRLAARSAAAASAAISAPDAATTAHASNAPGPHATRASNAEASVTPLPDAADRALVDARTLEQMAADALADIARLATTVDEAPPALAAATVVVRIDNDDLMSGIGVATIDDIDHPISTTTALGIAASAGLIPMVTTGDGEVLHLGRRQRLFTKAQRIALAERDGGCAHPDCARPTAHTQAHHILWWLAHSGPTDLSNGVLLCAFHHWMIHHDGWQIFIRDGAVWFVPPPHLDPEQRPRPGRRATRLDLLAA